MTSLDDPPPDDPVPWWLAGAFGLAMWLLLVWPVHSTLLDVVVLPLLIGGLRAVFLYRRHARNRAGR